MVSMKAQKTNLLIDRLRAIVLYLNEMDHDPWAYVTRRDFNLYCDWVSGLRYRPPYYPSLDSNPYPSASFEGVELRLIFPRRGVPAYSLILPEVTETDAKIYHESSQPDRQIFISLYLYNVFQTSELRKKTLGLIELVYKDLGDDYPKFSGGWDLAEHFGACRQANRKQWLQRITVDEWSRYLNSQLMDVKNPELTREEELELLAKYETDGPLRELTEEMLLKVDVDFVKQANDYRQDFEDSVRAYSKVECKTNREVEKRQPLPEVPRGY